jgi:DNA-binding transcriptional regulator LsrR (DeoR family)
MKGLPQSTDLTLHDYAYLRTWGLTMAECALWLGMSRENLRMMLNRAAQRGDTRSDYTPHVTECSGSYQSLQKRRERALRGEVA